MTSEQTWSSSLPSVKEAKTVAIGHRDRLSRWLCDEAFPLWSEAGTDWKEGGFYETIDGDGVPSLEPRRSRVVGRQLYAFAMSKQLGWSGSSEKLIAHGIEYLRRCCVSEAHQVIALSLPSGTIIDDRFDLYDHAFILFGLASLASLAPGKWDGVDPLECANGILRRMIAHWHHPIAGFEESNPRSLPLKANPHMHMLEACLAWEEAVSWSQASEWRRLADEIAELCLARFIDGSSGVLREYFDGEWRPISGDRGRIIEPGHQYEWAWLLQRWGRLRNRPDAIAAAKRLIILAENYGTNQQYGLAMSELWDDLTVKDGVCRLWQQTERIKAWLSMYMTATNEADEIRALENVSVASKGLLRFFGHPLRGGAWENMIDDGTFRLENSRASSLYHIVCSVAEMHKVL